MIRRTIALLFAALLPLSSCQTTPGGAAGVVQQLLPVLSTFADAAVRLHLTAAAAAKAPQLLAVLDTNRDGELELAEITGADWTAPGLAVVVLLTVEQLLAHTKPSPSSSSSSP